ncbi:YtxH domain-containing protein [Pseudarthrobacter sp. NPDC058362]|uniref:YtxH domain-containing protein n=1 Tax=Pseudarthrobacter sp. NPDC058362 TaxID=3346458 RepID=UPI00364F83A8
MKNKLLLGVGIATGYILGSRSGRAAYDKLKARAAGIWDSQPVQEKVTVATEAIKEKAPVMAEQLTEAARRAGTVVGSAMHRNDSAANSGSESAGTGSETPAAAEGLGDDHIPAHSTHPETTNLGTSTGNGTKP